MTLLWLLGCTGFIDAPRAVAGPCEGYRTETLLVDADGVWAGCGADTGLFRAPSVGGSFSAVAGYESFHVFDLHAGADGERYVAGDDADGSTLVWRMDDAPVLAYDGGSMRLSAAENLASTPGGRMVADSLTGNEYAVSDDFGESWEERRLSGYQVSHLVAVGDEIWGVGSTIAQPPTILAPDGDGFRAVELDVGWTGTIEELAETPAGGLVAVGADEDADVATMYHCAADCDEAGAWEALHVDEGFKLWSVSLAGDFGVAVGETPTGRGIARYTADGGITWAAISLDTSALTAAVAFDDGSVLVAGGNHTMYYGNP